MIGQQHTPFTWLWDSTNTKPMKPSWKTTTETMTDLLNIGRARINQSADIWHFLVSTMRSTSWKAGGANVNLRSRWIQQLLSNASAITAVTVSDKRTRFTVCSSLFSRYIILSNQLKIIVYYSINLFMPVSWAIWHVILTENQVVDCSNISRCASCLTPTNSSHTFPQVE